MNVKIEIPAAQADILRIALEGLIRDANGLYQSIGGQIAVQSVQSSADHAAQDGKTAG